jgi:hypothetical protein
MSNSIFIIQPYLFADTWVFDDESRGLDKEPFVAGIPEMIQYAIQQNELPANTDRFRLLFSAEPFPKYQHKITKLGPEYGGTNYCLEFATGERMEGWLCPALFKYFDVAPDSIYIKMESTQKNV